MVLEGSNKGPRGERSSSAHVLLLAALVFVAGSRLFAHGAAQDLDDLALDQMYNLEYDGARQTLEAQLRLHPDDLRALNYLGSLTLDEEFSGRGSTRPKPTPIGVSRR